MVDGAIVGWDDVGAMCDVPEECGASESGFSEGAAGRDNRTLHGAVCSGGGGGVLGVSAFAGEPDGRGF